MNIHRRFKNIHSKRSSRIFSAAEQEPNHFLPAATHRADVFAFKSGDEMNLTHVQHDNELYIRDLETNRHVYVYEDSEMFDERYGIVDDTGYVLTTNDSGQAAEIVIRFFEANEPNELESLLRACGYERIG